MTNTQKGVRIKILPTLKASVLLAAEHYRIGLILMWVPFVLLCVFHFIDFYWPELDLFIMSMTGFSEYDKIARYSFEVIKTLITMPFIIALYRFYILSEDNQKTWRYQRGLYDQKTMLKISWSFKIDKRVLQASLLSVIVTFLFMALRDINIAIKFKSIIDHPAPNFKDYVYIDYVIRGLKHLAFIAMILVWPAIAVSETFKFSSIPTLVKAIKGNFLRIIIIQLIIYIPLQIIAYLYFKMPESLWSSRVFHDLYFIISLALKFACYAVNIAFISLIYKDMKNTGHLIHA